MDLFKNIYHKLERKYLKKMYIQCIKNKSIVEKYYKIQLPRQFQILIIFETKSIS